MASSRQQLLEAYAKACEYPGVLDEAVVEFHLARYLKILHVDRKVERIRAGWNVLESESLLRYTRLVLDDFAKRSGRASTAIDARDASAERAARAASTAIDAIDASAERAARAASAARAARAARDARDASAARAASAARDARAARAARDASAAIDASAASAASAAIDARAASALQRFTSWCIHRNWWWWHSETSWLATTYLGAVQLNKFQVQAWSEPIYQAFLAGAWLLHWTEDTLFWVAKPTVHVERNGGTRRLHNSSYAAVESDLENLYFWHGVMVPAFVVVKPEWITAKHVLSEENVEVRRVMIERMGMERFLGEANATCIHRHEMGELFSINLPGDPEGVLRSVRVKDPSTGRFYFLRVPPSISRADDAVAWTFGFDTAKQYRPAMET